MQRADQRDIMAGATDGVFYHAAGIPTYGVGEIFIKNRTFLTASTNACR